MGRLKHVPASQKRIADRYLYRTYQTINNRVDVFLEIAAELQAIAQPTPNSDLSKTTENLLLYSKNLNDLVHSDPLRE